jgi:hypothetical protein
VARALTGLAIVLVLVTWLVPGILGESPLVVTAVHGLRGDVGPGTALAALSLVPLLLAAVSIATLLPPESSPPALARLVGAIAVVLLPAVAALTLVTGAESAAGIAVSVAIVLLAGVSWASVGLGVLVLGLLAGEEPDELEEQAPQPDDDSSRYFEEGTRTMEAWAPESTEEDEGEKTRMVQSPAAIIARSASTARPRPPEQQPARQPRQRTERPETATRTTVRDKRSAPPPDDDPEPPSADRTVILDRPFGKKRR